MSVSFLDSNLLCIYRLVKIWDARKYYGKGRIPQPWLTFDPALTKGRLYGK